MKKRIFSCFLAITLCLSLFSNTGFALDKGFRNTKYSQTQPQERKVHIVQDQEDLRAKLSDSSVQDGDIIELKGSGFVNDPNSNSAPWVINKSVTFRGGSINMRAGGILLGANVTFEDTTLTFTNPVRNVIIANGYQLKLNNVLRDTGARKIYLVCGGLTGDKEIVAHGNHSDITISGKTNLQGIYAGSLSSNGTNNSSDIPATLTIDLSVDGAVGTIYGSGAKETVVDKGQMINPSYEPAPPEADAQKYITNGQVTINTSGTKIRTIEGKTGGANDVKVVYRGDGNLNSSLALKNISTLVMESGHLAPVKDSSIGGANSSISIAENAKLNLSNFNAVTQINEFTGGGVLILGQRQRLNIQNTVTGMSQVGIGGVFSNSSTEAPLKNHVYIAAPKSTQTSFKLIPHSSAPTATFTHDKNGNWLIPDASSSTTKISSINLPKETTLATENQGIEIPIDVTYSTPDAMPMLSSIKMSVMVNGKTATVLGNATDGYMYQSIIGTLEIGAYDDGEMLSIWGLSDDLKIAPGDYEIKLMISKKYMENDQFTTVVTRLKVSDDVVPPSPQETDLSKAIVTIDGEYFYTGKEQTPTVTVELDGKKLNENTDYILSVTNHTNAGTATVTINPAPNSAYTNSTSKDFTIQKAALAYTDATIASKIYNGTTDATVTAVSFVDESHQNAPVTLEVDKDYTVAAEYNDANVRQANQVMVEVQLKGDAATNYNLKNSTITLKDKHIEKATITANKSTLSVFNKSADTYTYDLTTMLPQLDGPKEYGTKTFQLGAVTLGEYYKKGASVTDTTLMLPIEKVESDKQSEVGKVAIEITTDNYTISDSFIVVNSVNKKLPQGTPTLSKRTLVYGQLLSEIILSGDMKDTEGQLVEGKFSWDTPDKKYPVGTNQATWTFTPKDKEKYLSVSGTEEIVVEKAVSVGKPQYDVITSTDKTLADANLNGFGTAFSTPGNVQWQLANNTPVEENISYRWRFTPTDDGYQAIEGNVILYPTAPSGGVSGSGSIQNETNIKKQK